MNIIRHFSVFNPECIKGRIGIAGVGALGSALAINLAKLGIGTVNSELVLFDHDTIESHNLPNQLLYGPQDIDKPKAACAAEMIHRLTGSQPIFETVKLETRDQLKMYDISILFVCVDSMAARKAIYDKCVVNNIKLNLLIDGRMGATGGMSLVIPNTVAGNKYYTDNFYGDDAVIIERGACGNILSIGATAMALASQMTWAFINACDPKQGALQEVITNFKNPAVEFICETKVAYSR